MSLKIWLPLTQDLRNQGTSNISVINNGATIANNGKLGKCYSFNGSSHYLQLPYNFYNNTYTVSVWFYVTNTTATHTICCCRTAVGVGFSIFLIGGKLRIDSGGNSSTQQWTTNYTYPANTWVHLAITYDGTNTSYYINGEFKERSAFSLNSSSWGSVTSIGASQANGTVYGNYLAGKLNDVRIYDHALSISEIKELAKGLVAHYPLNNNGLGNINLLTKTRPSVDGIGTMGSYNGGNASVDNNITFNGYPTIKIIPSSSNTSSGVWNKYAETVNLKSGVAYTYSCWIYSTVADTFSSSSLGHFQTYTSSAMHNRSISHEGDSIPANTWTHVYITFTPTADCKFYSFWIYFANTSQIIYIAEPKLEVGTKATKWCPNIDNGYLSSGSIVKDTSGNGYHGTITGTLTSDLNTPKNSSCYYFDNGVNNKITAPISLGTDYITMNIWIKSKNGANGTGNYHMPFEIDGAQYEMSIGNDGKFRQGFYINGSRVVNTTPNPNIISDKKWHMITATYDGTNIKRYVDGELVQTQAVTGTLAGGDRTVYIGGTYGATTSYATKELYESDARIYATALSAEDIKELYNIGAKIDNKQNLYSSELKEPLAGASSNQFLKTGVIQTNELGEDIATKIFKDGTILTNTYYEF